MNIKITKKQQDLGWVIFRVLVGFLFFTHGAQKLFGWFTDKAATQLTLSNIMFWAGLIETIAGVAIALGLLSRFFASISAVEMLIAYFKVHIPKSWLPTANGGELALLFFATMLIIAIHGGGAYTLDKLFKNKSDPVIAQTPATAKK